MEGGGGKEGFMMKEGGKISSKWQKRYCVIRGADFCYYKKKGAAQMQGSINLKTCSAIKMIGTYKKKKDCFNIVTPSKTYTLYSCDGDSEAWVKALNDATKASGGDKPDTTTPEPTKPVDPTKPADPATPKNPDTGKVNPGSNPTTSNSKDVKCLFDMSKHVLPQELMIHVFSLCAPKDLGSAVRVNKQWKGLTEEDMVWKKLFEKLPGGASAMANKKEEQTWKQYYKEFRSIVELSLEQVSALKELIPFLKEEGTDSKILEFHQIWLESFPEMKRQLWAQKKRQFKMFVSSDFLQVSWYMGGVQAEFIQGMVDFFWNVGAPESEIDKLNDVGAICNPLMVGSWIDMSKKGGMDGGWYFPVEIPIAKAFEAADKGHEAFRTLKSWTEKNNFTSCYSVKRDMGAAPPRQTEFKFKLAGDFTAQSKLVKETLATFGFPEIPAEKWDILTESKIAGIRISVIITDEGFARVGVLFPQPPPSVVKRLCTGDAAVLNKLEAVLRPPTFVEYFNLNAGFGYGVYATGHSIGFHFCVNGPDGQFN